MAYALYAIIYKIQCSAKRPLTLFVYLFIAFSIFYLLARISVIIAGKHDGGMYKKTYRTMSKTM